MNNKLKVPPRNKIDLTKPEDIKKKLKGLLGSEFKLTRLTRTDGSNMRKLIAATLFENDPPVEADMKSFEILPFKKKGVPRILLEYIDSYIVTSGKNYNLQVWNRNPTAESVQIQYINDDVLLSNEVRFVLTKVDVKKDIIDAIAILTPDYIERRFGKFGKPTIKSQMIISDRARNKVLSMKNKILFYNDGIVIGNDKNLENIGKYKTQNEPCMGSLLPLKLIKDIIQNNIIGRELKSAQTKNRGQILEEMVITALGYRNKELAGGYPDIRNQALEIKVQDSPTVDLGRFSPEFEEEIKDCAEFTTRNMRYFIALTNPSTNIIEGGIICPGNKLGNHFTYVANKSYKCQRSIPMSFFEEIDGKVVYNP